MSVLAIFQFEGQVVRVSDRDGMLWFVAKDLCEALEMGNPRQAIARLPVRERDDVQIVDAIGRNQAMTIISEPGMYRLVMTSRKPSAQRFQDWVVGEVLPSIRRTGSYTLPAPANDAVPVSDFAACFETPSGVRSINAKIAFLRAAGNTFGNAAAQEAWRIACLPDVAPESSVHFLPDRDEGVARWVDERLCFSPQRDTALNDLYEDYVHWCRWFGGITARDKFQFHQHLRLNSTGGENGHPVLVSGVELHPPQSMLDGAGGTQSRYSRRAPR